MKTFLAMLLLSASSQAFSECSRPLPPAIPDGAEADLAAMVEGQKGVKAFVAASEEYLKCLTAEGEAAAETETEEQTSARIDEYNSSVDAQEAIAGEFNAEIREYKENSQ
jgi:hypothetical protein